MPRKKPGEVSLFGLSTDAVLPYVAVRPKAVSSEEQSTVISVEKVDFENCRIDR
jgi:hypothetical protein